MTAPGWIEEPDEDVAGSGFVDDTHGECARCGRYGTLRARDRLCRTNTSEIAGRVGSCARHYPTEGSFEAGP